MISTSWVLLSIATVSYLVGQVLRGVRLRLLIAHESNLELPTATNVVVMGYALNTVLPLRLGELVRAGVLSLSSGFPFFQSCVITSVERWLDATVILAYLLISGFALGFGESVLNSNGIEILAAFVGLGLVAVLALVVFPGIVVRGVSRLSARLGMKVHDLATGLASGSVHGVAGLSNPSILMKVLAVSCLTWLAEAGMYFTLIGSFAKSWLPTSSLYVMSATNAAIGLPGAAAHGGVFQSTASSSVTQLGLDSWAAENVSQFAHAIFSMTAILWGGIVILGYTAILLRRAVLTSRSKEVAKQTITMRAAELTGERSPVYLPFSKAQLQAEPTRIDPLIFMIVDGLMPETPESANRHSNITYVSRFVQNQLRNLPDRYRVLFKIALTGFFCISLLRFFRPLNWVDTENRRKWMAAWAYGPIGLTRKMFRPIRSLAFLAYYELPGTISEEIEPVEEIRKAVGAEAR